MKVLTAKQIREWDAYTIAHEPIASVDLMERAARACTGFILEHYTPCKVLVLCGKGNNGGDGLAIARMLREAGYEISVFLVENSRPFSPDADINAKRFGVKELKSIQHESDLPPFEKYDLILDAIYGTGYRQKEDTLFATLCDKLLPFQERIISIDMPSGLQAYYSKEDDLRAIKAVSCNTLLSFQVPKQGFLLTETGNYYRRLELLDIGLHKDYKEEPPGTLFATHIRDVQQWYKPRPRVSHKGSFGKLLLIGGLEGYYGSIILSARAAFRSGCGYVYVATEKENFPNVIQHLPEAILLDIHHEKIAWENYDACVIGPGLGKSHFSKQLINNLLDETRTIPLVIDADALNLISEHYHTSTMQWPEDVILTPHLKEFERLFGNFSSSTERISFQQLYAWEKQITLILKGANSTTATSEGQLWFNLSGNSGLAKAGSGDVLSGILGALLAQGYETSLAARYGVWMHGAAADLLLERHSQSMESMLPSDIINTIPEVYKFYISKNNF